ncbi:MAG: LysM peptidoglycan-binding domain-containing M23 family metallopeptidase [Alphaproteobacteria bacterium]|nr:LysM peptidoglycan-binding domain-containing M23 family metallopeptidase [Alphaproteobacteria bacterium]
MIVRIAAAMLVISVLGCARSGPPAPVVNGDQTPQPTTFVNTSEVKTVTLRGATPATWAAPRPAVVSRPLQKAPLHKAEDMPRGSVEAGRLAVSRKARVRVGRGDTLYAISRRHGVPLRALIRANGLKPPYRLTLGRELRIPESRYYVVGVGDTVYRLSRRFSLPPERIIRINRIKTAGFKLYPGQKLLLPRDGKMPRRRATKIAVARALQPPRSEQKRFPVQTHAMAPPREVVKAPKIVKRGPPAKKPKLAKERPAKVQKAFIPEPPPAATPPAAPRKRTASLTTPPSRAGAFLWPIEGKLLSSYGSKGGGLYNDGINIAANLGAPVRAVESGVVAYAGNELKGYGNLLLIRHEGGWVSAYAHTSRILVSKGQVVRRGQMIAKVGQSGAVDKPQLHFELRRGPNAVNPLKHLEKDAKVRS